MVPTGRYYGSDASIGRGQNWNFDKEPDMWGYQPGVFLMGNGRVASVVLTGFGIKGSIPDAIGQLTELQMLILGTHNDMIGGRTYDDIDISVLSSPDKKLASRMDYDNKFLNYDVRSGLSETLVDGINMFDNNFLPVKKDSRIELKDVQVGSLTNELTGISKALMRCTKLEFLYIANSPIPTDFLIDIQEGSPFYEEREELSWANLDKLTDMEIYNCPNLTSLPMDMLSELPELQLLNVASNTNIPGDELLDNWIDFIYGNSGSKIQVLYMGNNNLTTIPDYDELQMMEKLGLLDCSNNKITTVNPFGKEISLVRLYLDNNYITEIPNVDGYFFGYNDTELFSCSNNRLTQVPDIFNAKSKYVINGVNLSNNQISSFENGENYKGINAADLNISNNKFERFPYQLFKSGSPINTLNVSGNGMTTIKKGDLQGKNSHLLVSIDFTFNKLKEIPAEDFYPTNLPYLYGVEFSYNEFANFPVAPLSCNGLTVFSIRHQRDKDGNRILRQWPNGIYKCPSLRAFFIGSNDYRKIEDYISPDIRVFDIKDNPNISIDISDVCPYIQAGYYKLMYDPWQNIQGCDALDLE
jgi:hypothetical protein